MKLRARNVGGRRYWQVDLGKVDGRRLRRHFKSKGAAKKFLTAARKERSRHGSKAFSLSEPERLSFLRAQGRLREAGASIDQAVDFFLERRPRVNMTVAEAVGECRAAKEAAGRRPTYLQHLKNKLGLFTVSFADRHLASIEPREIEEWLGANGWAAATRKSLFADIQTLFSWARRRGAIVENPCARIDKILLEDKPPGILKVAECRRLLKAALEKDRGLAAYLAIALFCGVRPHELRQLSWADVDRRRGLVTIAGPKAKSRRRRLVTIPPNAKAWLALRGDLPVKNLFRRLDKIRAAAGIPWPHDCLRHSFASYYLAEHQSADRTAHEMGHGSTVMLYAHYRALVTPTSAKQFWALTPASVMKEEPEEGQIVPMNKAAGQ